MASKNVLIYSWKDHFDGDCIWKNQNGGGFFLDFFAYFLQQWQKVSLRSKKQKNVFLNILGLYGLFMKCYDYAINYIYRFPKSEHELKAKLLQKGYFSDEVNNTIEKLKTKGYVDDKMFAESYIRSEVINKGKPVIRLMRKLHDKGIDQDLVKNVLKEFEEEINEGLNEKIQKEITNYKRKGVEGFDIIQKLLRKGYKLDDIKNVIQTKKE